MMRCFARRTLFIISALVSGACSSPASDDPGTGGQTNSGTGGVRVGAGEIGSGGAIGNGGTFVPPPMTGGGTGGVPATGGTSNGGARAGTGGSAAVGGRGVGSGGTPSGGSTGSTDPGTVGDGDFTVGPTYTPSPDGSLKAGAPAGFTVSFTMSSAMSSIFNGADFTPPLTFPRSIRVFVPQQYIDGTESPFMVSSDGFYAALQTVVQNLASDPSPDHHVPPLVIIGIQNGPDVRPSSERSLEYDTVSDRYWQFVTKEVIPAVLSNAALKARFPNFKLTSDPNGRGGYGCSSGGPAVMGLAWFGDFNRVLSFSGSYTALHPNPEHPFGAWEYTKMITDAPLRPDLRVFLEVGQNDNGAGTADALHRNWVTSNQNMAAALKAKGNHYRFIYATGAGHCDNNARNQVMPEGLIWLWRGYKAR